MKIRFVLGMLMLSFVAGSGAPARSTRAGPQTPCGEEHTAWVGEALKKLETIKPGMTRKELLTVTDIEGGLSTTTQRTYVSRDCPYFKVDVEFSVFGGPKHDSEGRLTNREDDRDVIVKVSRPYLQFSIMD
ncbi:MAG TPA: hypothetical protein VFO34_02515 [Candidatus Acidoferrales bacterium]|nr:hypothetical protein [Candidatus Acidoferrales bacterium]